MDLFSSADAIPAGYWRWPHVDPAKEWACKGTGQVGVDIHFLDQFEKLRRMMGTALIISSGYRSPQYNNEVSDTGSSGPHTTGRAVDIRIYGDRALALVALAISLGYSGVGVSQKNKIPHKRFIHLDNLTQPAFPRPTIWSY